MEEASSKLQFELASVYRDMLGHVKYIGKGRPGSGYEDRDILVGERIEDGYKVFYISDSRIVMKKKYKRLTRKSIEIFLNNVRGLREAREHVADEKRQLDFKMIITAELRDTDNKAVEFIDGSFDTDRFLASLAMKKPKMFAAAVHMIPGRYKKWVKAPIPAVQRLYFGENIL